MGGETNRQKSELAGLGPAIVTASEQAKIGISVALSGAGVWRREYVNRAAADLLGYEQDELLALPPDAVFADADQARIEAWRKRRQQGAERTPSLIEVVMLRKDGSEFAARLATSTTSIGSASGRVDFFFDGGERERATRELESAEARFRRLLDAAPDAVIVATAERVVYVNPGFMRLLGSNTTSETVRVPQDAHVHPDDRALAIERVHRVLAGEQLPPFVFRVLRDDGSEVTLEVIDMLVDWNGQPAALAIGRDLSERRQIQAALMRADRLTALGTLAAGVAHEINNPLAYVLLNLQYLLRELPRFDGSTEGLGRLAERLSDCRHGADRVGTIVRDLRALSRSEREELTPVELVSVISSAVKIAGAELSTRARIFEDYARVRPVAGTPARLEQVFLNLLINAAQALDPATADTNSVRLSLREEGERVVATVTDNGPGILPELVGRIFDPFFSTKPPGMGSGLGLPICNSIVSSLGGEIAVESAPGHGTSFRVSLPALEVGARPRAPTPLPTSTPRARVLVVDDELPLAMVLKRVLEDEHEVLVASSAEEALELILTDGDFDVVLCDVLMPGTSGVDLFGELSMQRPALAPRVVFMTGGAFTARAAEFLAGVSNPRLEKPFDLGQLRRLVRDLTRGARARSGDNKKGNT